MFECSDAIEIRHCNNGIVFDFYIGLLHYSSTLYACRLDKHVSMVGRLSVTISKIYWRHSNQLREKSSTVRHSAAIVVNLASKVQRLIHRYRPTWSTIAYIIQFKHNTQGKITQTWHIYVVEVFSTEYTIQRIYMVAVGNTHQAGYPSDCDVEGSTTYSHDCSIPHSVPEHWHRGQPAWWWWQR